MRLLWCMFLIEKGQTNNKCLLSGVQKEGKMTYEAILYEREVIWCSRCDEQVECCELCGAIPEIDDSIWYCNHGQHTCSVCKLDKKEAERS
jgi:hypothetical protein